MINITKCKLILNKNGIIYTDEEIVKIREVLYKLAEAYAHTKKTISHKSNL